MRFLCPGMLVAAVLSSGLVAPSLVEAGPFGPGRSEGRPTAKKKKAKPTKSKAKLVKAVDDDIETEADDDDDEPVKKAKAEPKKSAPRKAKPVPVEDDVEEETIAIVEDKPAPKAKPEPKKPAPKKPAPKAEPVEDESLVIIEETPAPKAVAKAPAMVGAMPVVDDEEPADDEEPDPVDDEEDDTEDEPKQVAAADDDGEVLETSSVSKAVIKAKPHKTRFYFRAGAMKQSTKLGATSFSLDTDLPVDAGSLGEGSGVETQQNQIPVGAIIGVVLPVLDRKLSLETVLGIPTPTRFKATGKLANESLAPQFMGMDTGIEPLGPDLAEATFSPPIVTGVYRIAKLGPVTPIVGTGLMLLMARNAKVTNAVLNEAGDPKLSISPSPGLVLQGGLDIALWKRVAARIDVKYVLGMKVNATIEDIAVTPKAIPTLGSIEVGDAVMSAKVAPLIVQAGVGVDF